MPSERTGPDLHGIIVTGLSLVLGAILLVILLQIVHHHLSAGETERKVLAAPHAEYEALVEAQRAELAAGDGIEAAMAEVVARHGDEGAREGEEAR